MFIMTHSSVTVIDIKPQTDAVATNYANFLVSSVNDHVVSVMNKAYYWHYYPNSDETFVGIEGILLIDLQAETLELLPGQLVTIPKNTIHRTRPKRERSVNLTIEHSQIETVTVDTAV